MITIEQNLGIEVYDIVSSQRRKDFEMPLAMKSMTDTNLSCSCRYACPGSTTDYNIMGYSTINLGKYLVVTPEVGNLYLALSTPDAPHVPGPYLLFTGGQTTVIHAQFGGVFLKNETFTATEGRIFIAGDRV